MWYNVNRLRALAVLVLSVCLYAMSTSVASAAGADCGRSGCQVRDTEINNSPKQHAGTRAPGVDPRHRRASPSHRGGQLSVAARVAAANRRIRKQQRQINAEAAAYHHKIDKRNACLSRGQGPAKCGPSVATQLFGGVFAQGVLVPGQPRNPAAPPRVTLTADQVAYVAFARLKLTAPKLMVGPPPSVNKWHMAAVGYPLWLWVAGTTDPAPVSDSVGGLFVSLDAHLSKVVFSMGDGTKVTCNGTGTAWGRWVQPGQKSPTCGHSYSEPSLPKGNYTITATTYWSVAWNVTGQTGVIPFVQSASTTLPVGELQVLVR